MIHTTSAYARLQMNAARMLRWVLSGGMGRLSVVALIVWALFCLAPTYLLPFPLLLLWIGAFAYLVWRITTPQALAKWLLKQEEMIWWEAQKPLLRDLLLGGMSEEAASALLSMHRNAERNGGVFDPLRWEKENLITKAHINRRQKEVRDGS